MPFLFRAHHSRIGSGSERISPRGGCSFLPQQGGIPPPGGDFPPGGKCILSLAPQGGSPSCWVSVLQNIFRDQHRNPGCAMGSCRSTDPNAHIAPRGVAPRHCPACANNSKALFLPWGKFPPPHLRGRIPPVGPTTKYTFLPLGGVFPEGDPLFGVGYFQYFFRSGHACVTTN